MRIEAFLRKRIQEIIVAPELLKEWPILREAVTSTLPDSFAMTPPRDPAHGEYACNAAMILARKAGGMKPVQLAGAIVAKLADDKIIEAASVAGPGFINIRLTRKFWLDQLRSALQAGEDWGRSDIGGGVVVNLEFVSANPTGPLHIAHARGAIIGDALGSLMEFAGWQVTREYYVNDAGGQVDALARSAYLRYREALGEDIGEIPAGLYPGEYLAEIGAEIAAHDGTCWLAVPEEEWLPFFRTRSVELLMVEIKADLTDLGVRHDVFRSERALLASGAVEQAIERLRADSLIYRGELAPPKGKNVDWEAREQLLFRSSSFGDDVDRPLQKSNGDWTYFAGDIAYHYDKWRRGASLLIDVLGADHGGYAKRIQAALRALAHDSVRFDVLLCQMVHVLEQGKPMRMSKRAGTFVTLRDVLDTVGRDVLRFIMLTRQNDQTLAFDLSVVQQESRDNPVWYVQYAHARCASVARRAGETFPGLDCIKDEERALANLALLDQEQEGGLLRMIGRWPDEVEIAARLGAPHRIVFFLTELASLLHGIWTSGRACAAMRFIFPEDRDRTLAKLALARGAQIVLARGLRLLGVDPAERL